MINILKALNILIVEHIGHTFGRILMSLRYSAWRWRSSDVWQTLR